MYCKIKDKNGFYDEFNIFECLIFTKPCIYFLIQTKEYGIKTSRKVVYVGKSKRGMQRIFEHSNKKFDAFSYIICNENDLDKLEKEYIDKYRPIYNKSILKGINQKEIKHAKDILDKKGKN